MAGAWDTLFLEALRYEGSLREAFLRGILRVFATSAEIERLLNAGDLQGALQAILGESGSSTEPLYHAIRVAMADHADRVAEQVKADLLANIRRITVRWDMANPRAMQTIQETKFNLIVGVDDPTREAVRQILARQMAEGRNPRSIIRDLVGPLNAKGIRITDHRGVPLGGVIGLNQRQINAVQNFERMLKERDREAMTRVLRDKRYDGTLRRLMDGEKVSKAKIRHMVDRYKTRMLAHRAETIARTESIRALQRGRIMFWENQTTIPLEDLEKKWNTARDERVRKDHRVMEGKVVDFNGKFMLPDGELTDWPPNGVNCRCLASILIKKTGAIRAVA